MQNTVMDPEEEVRRMGERRPPYYWASLNFPELMKEYPPPPDFFNTVYRMPRAQLREP